MRAILPGRPQSKRQALSTAHWDGLRLIAYISGNAAIIATGPKSILQTIYVDTVESLVAIAIEESSGRIALCDDTHVYVYDAIGRDEGLLKWLQAHDLMKDGDSRGITSLSWSSPEELLVGGSRLLLWHLSDSAPPKVLWERTLPYPTALASLSHDGALIASCGQHDKLVKIWRRLSYEEESTRFDVSYLPHPASITNVHWRKPWHAEQNLDSLLYTFCADNHVRVWAYSDLHSLSVMQPVANIDMNSSIQPRRLSFGSISRRRFAFIVDSRDFSNATEKAVQSATSSGVDHALEHLIETANRSPEICVVLDGIGHMSAWGLENAGIKNKNATLVFNIAHVDGMKIALPPLSDPLEDYYNFCVFAGGATLSSLSLMVHSYTGCISWYDSQITKLFDTSARDDRVQLSALWTGHDDLVDRVVRDQSGQQLCSWAEDGNLIVWRATPSDKGAPLLMRSCYEAGDQMLDALFGTDDSFLVILKPDRVEVLNLDTTHAYRVATSLLLPEKRPASLMQIDNHNSGQSSTLFGIIYGNRSIECWRLDLPTSGRNKLATDLPLRLGLVEHLKISLNDDKTVIIAAAHVQSRNCSPGKFSSSSYAACTISKYGVLQGYESSQGALPDSHSFVAGPLLQTNISKPAFASAVSSGKVAVVDHTKTSLTIWDLSMCICEMKIDFKGPDAIERLSWTSTQNGHLILAVCFAFQIVVFGQTRFRRTPQVRAWTRLQTIRVRNFTTHAIGDLCFLGSGDLVIAAGNQLLVLEGTVDQIHVQDQHQRTRAGEIEQPRAKDVTDSLNAILSVVHSDFLHLVVNLGKFEFFKKMIFALHRHLKYFSEGDALPSTLDFQPSDLVNLVCHQPGTSDAGNPNYGAHLNGVNNEEELESSVTESLAQRVQEALAKYELPMISEKEKSRLSNAVNFAKELGLHQNSLDDNGLRYIQALHSHEGTDLPWSAIVFASLSTSHEILINIVTEFYGGKLTWEAARKSGLFMWLSDPQALRTQMESVARSEYTKHEDRNPVDCSLYYFALRKKNVLQGLWRMTIGVREKENTMKLLANNFNDPKWKGTALKNAYALISKRRFEYAAAFFLLGGSLKDAVNVCIHQLRDLQLAVAITRVYEQDNDNTLKELVEKTILPMSIASEQGRWMASWAFNTLGAHDRAIQVIVRPVHQVVDLSFSDIEGLPGSLSYLADDPSLSALYTQLRSRLHKKHEWTGVISPREEWNFVMRCVRHYVRMGCDVLALALARGWEFLPEDRQVDRVGSIALEKVSSAADDHTTDDRNLQKTQQGKPKAPPTQFQEPSASSLLDSFGF